MCDIVGRDEEIEIMRDLEQSRVSEFLVVYGRRRIGKTFLIRELFQDKFVFSMTGIDNVNMTQQLMNFNLTLRQHDASVEWEPVNCWLLAFQQLRAFLEKSKKKRKIVFIDELPWFDTLHSDFIQGLEHFWNSWASGRKDIFLIVSGSATSWMINKLINNRGGLHNRVTQRICLEPFTLAECSEFMKRKNVHLDQYQLIQLYMVMGGVPYYWDKVTKGKSASQIIERECFSRNGSLKEEFNNIFKSLFRQHQRHVSIVKALATKSKGLSRDKISKLSGISNGGGLTRLLDELEACHFITRYIPFGRVSRDSLYQLNDMFSLFHLRFMQTSTKKDAGNWLKTIDSPKHRAWSGYAFEQVCMQHSAQIKKALGISGIETHISSWRSRSDDSGAQADMIIDRRDQIINLCEMKYSVNPYIINKKYAAELSMKAGRFRYDTKTKKAVHIVMLTTFGVANMELYGGIVQHNLTMDCLFEKA